MVTNIFWQNFLQYTVDNVFVMMAAASVTGIFSAFLYVVQPLWLQATIVLLLHIVCLFPIRALLLRLWHRGAEGSKLRAVTGHMITALLPWFARTSMSDWITDCNSDIATAIGTSSPATVRIISCVFGPDVERARARACPYMHMHMHMHMDMHMHMCMSM